jgi:hypothetical protein
MQDFFVNPIKESQDFLVTPKFYFIIHPHQTDTMPTPPTTDYRLPLPPYLVPCIGVRLSTLCDHTYHRHLHSAEVMMRFLL